MRAYGIHAKMEGFEKRISRYTLLQNSQTAPRFGEVRIVVAQLRFVCGYIAEDRRCEIMLQSHTRIVHVIESSEIT